MARKIRKIKRVTGTAARPRLSVYRSLRGLYVQFINDDEDKTIVGISSLGKGGKKKAPLKNNLESAKAFGKIIAKVAIEKGIKEVVFDRGSRRYHGKIKAMADAAREAGLSF
ncbi:MAG: 50S ribosomal protein L18 [Candidatus Margulisbacteria bacterium]|nr:50S ribosomal protein L18 [Candidatus Margulisiibacteriota bacterium]MBU1022091.1 50S ribosomal protein L18 [Candidatus Margulisiibacteriota bacterium]MBU1729686.1 50S ribosomal protein L18 [Candidatus Margulisiibacteriota bacterium]MBU1955006.1 50S ribosomal protein L18 [Candidatus Margulisiibacteriota bacterium]